MINLMEMELLTYVMDIFMMGIFLREKRMEKVHYFPMIRNLNLKEIGLMMRKRVMELRIFLMGLNMKGILRKGRKMEKVRFY